MKDLGKDLTQEEFNQLRLPKGKDLTDEDWKKLTSDEDKACHYCHYRVKVKGQLSDSPYELQEDVYGCCLSQSKNFTKDVIDLPEHCRARNLVNVEDKAIRPEKVLDNCKICMVYSDYKPVCKTLKVTYCPCKNCADFMINEVKGCFNYKEECKKRVIHNGLLDTK
jgi:hypothetical protein